MDNYYFYLFSLSRSKLIPYILPVFPAMALLTGTYLSPYLNRKLPRFNAYVLLPFIWLILGGLGGVWLLIDPSTVLPKSSLPF